MEQTSLQIAKIFGIIMIIFTPLFFGYEIIKILLSISKSAFELIILAISNKNSSFKVKIYYVSIGFLIIYAELLLPLLVLFIASSFLKFLKPIYLIYKKLIFFPYYIFNKNFGKDSKEINIESDEKKDRIQNITLKTTNRDIIIPNPFRGILVIGGAGSGKSESFAVPLIREFAKQNFAGIVYDFKYPTLAQDVERQYLKNDSKINRYYINLSNPIKSHRVNPLNPDYMPFSAFAREFASAIIKNLMKESIRKEDFWSRSATDLLTACIWYLRKEHPSLCDLPHVLALLTTPHKDLIMLLAKNPEVRTMIASLVTAVESEAAGQLAGVVGSLQGAAAQINTPEFMYIFGGNDFSLDLNNPQNPSVMVIGSNPLLANSLAPLCSLLITVASKQMNQPQKEKSFILIDESPTVFIPNIEVIPNTGRSNKISTVLFIQDISQLIDGYGKEKSDVLFSSCANHFYGKVSSSQTADILSKQFGKQDKMFKSDSQSRKNFDIFQKNILIIILKSIYF